MPRRSQSWDALVNAVFLAAGVAYGVQLILLGMLHLGGRYSIISHAVSDYGVGGTRRLFIAYGLVGCLASIMFAWALFDDGRFPRRGWLCLVLVAVLRLGVLAFPTDLKGTRPTRSGRLHYAFAIASFAFLYMAIDSLHPIAFALVAKAAIAPLVGLRWLFDPAICSG